MEILTGEQMRRIDRRTIDDLGVPGLELMEAAGRGVAEALLEDYRDTGSSEVLVLCGKGNNGGDGLVVARYLAARGLRPRVTLMARADDISGDASVNLDRARRAGLEVREAPDEAAWNELRQDLDDARIILDALLGTGVKGGARGLIARVIEDVNAADGDVVAVDLPSGINADITAVEGTAVRARRTYTLCRPKLPLLVGPASSHSRAWRVIPIGIPDEAVRAERPELEWLDAAAARPLLPERPDDGHKGTFGHLLGIAGSRGKSGAAVLLARGALRCGVGLVTVATPASNQERVAIQQAEMMTEPLPETQDGGLAVDCGDRVVELLADRDALALGPGLGASAESGEAARAVVRACTVPLVIDADGLNALAPDAGHDVGIESGTRGMVLTPHPGEAARLLGVSAAEVQADRLAAARTLARSARATVVLKGHRSLVAHPDGRLAVNSTGNPGMATAGTGDVLTGMIGALLARRIDPWDAARLAVYIHGSAGDRAAARLGMEGLIASDVLEEVPMALRALVTAEEK